MPARLPGGATTGALLLVAAGLAACATGPRIERSDLLGRTYAVEGVVGEAVSGTVTFEPDGRIEVRCRGSREQRGTLTSPDYREITLRVCEATLRMRRDADGRLFGILEREVRETRGMREECTRWEVDENGNRVCVSSRVADVVQSRTQRVEIPLPEVRGG